ncbi:MAG: site-specific DNA-methyltransferase, partial [Alphaproteobacteria bacterium]|nr:site-specific DNA-methyltransferase [Alphaproteobacteria bacterium]
LFQLDRGDLDFGLYRIMALKSGKVEDFLKNSLLPQVDEALKGIAEVDIAALRKEREEQAQIAKSGSGAAASAKIAEMEKEVAAAKVEELTAQIAAAKPTAAAEAETYDHLHTFFARYYDEGDFMSLRRYKGAGKEAYLIPYNGEEVKLHWANADQFYIKTAENYASYIFKLEGGRAPHRVRFEIAAADAEKDNIKETSGKKRFFVLAENWLAEDGGDLAVRFEHRPLRDGEQARYLHGAASKRKTADQEIINSKTEARILQKLSGGWRGALAAKAATEADPNRTVLGKHLAAYAAKNSFDYFIHKDLGAFLRRELDHYLKSEVVSMENLELAEDAAFRRTLAQAKAVKKVGGKIIDFLAQLEDFQKKLWLKKKFVMKTDYCITLDKLQNAPAKLRAQIAANEAQRAEWRELFGAEKLPSKTAGEKLCAENPSLVLDTRHFPAEFTGELLASLDDIDAQLDGLLVHGENFQALNLLQARYQGEIQSAYIDPPFNTGDDFCFKDSYRFSSWMSLLQDRLTLGRNLLSPSGSHFLHLDHNANFFGRMLMNSLFGEENFMNEIIWRIGWVSGYKTMVDAFVRNHDTLFYYAKNKAENFFLKKLSNIPYTSYETKMIGEELDSIMKKWNLDKKKVTNTKVTMKYASGEVFKIGLKTKEGKYHMEDTWNSSEYEELHSNKIKRNAVEYTPHGAAITQKPEELLERVINLTTNEGDVVLDYFGGAGTTPAVAYKLNRKFVAVEVESYFDDDILWRLKKAFSGHQVGISRRVPKRTSGFLKYIRLESYEDALDSLRHELRDDIVEREENRKMREEYHLRYALGEETADSETLLGGDFIAPFSYKLSVVRDGVRRDERVDLAETFNYLLGLRVSTRKMHDGALAITGAAPNGDKCLVIWRDLNKMNAAELEKWFEKHCAEIRGGLHRVYVNGEQNLAALRGDRDQWSVEVTELVFRQLMFSGENDG